MRKWSCGPLVTLLWSLPLPTAIDEPENDEQETDGADERAGDDDGIPVPLLLAQVVIQIGISWY